MKIITRDQWGSKSKFKGEMKLPAVNVFLHHSVTLPTDFPYRDVKQIENVGLTRFGQISYSYLVHPNGTVLEGAGTKVGAHTEGRNSTSFGICLIGDYTTVTPTGPQVEAVQFLLQYLKVEKKWLEKKAVLTPHRAVKATQCPGDETMVIFAQFSLPYVPPTKEVAPMFSPALALEPIAAELSLSGGVYLLATSGAIYAFGGAPAVRGANGRDFFAGRQAARLYEGTNGKVPDFAKGPTGTLAIQTTSGEWYGPFAPTV